MTSRLPQDRVRSLLRWLAARLVRGDDADFIRHDLDELYMRDRAEAPAWRAYEGYVRRLVASILSVWADGIGRRYGRSKDGRGSSGRALVDDLRFAVRLGRRQPGPVAMTVGGLGLAIGIAAAAFSIVNASLLRPYGMDDPDSVVVVARTGEPAWVGLPYRQFLRMRDGSALLRVEAAVDERVRVSAAPGQDGLADRPVLFVSGGYLEMLGGRPSLGRSLQPADAEAGAQPVIVVSHHFWRTGLNADASVVGKTMWVNGVAATLVGVLQPTFTGPVDIRRALWMTLATYDDVGMGQPMTVDRGPTVEVVGRLAPEVSISAAQANLSALLTDPASPASGAPGQPMVQVSRAAAPIDLAAREGDVRLALAFVFAVIGLVLALACINTANLLMAATVTRTREIGVRLALGATRARLVRQTLTESGLLGLAAGGLGFLCAFALVPVFGAMVAMPPEMDLSPDRRVLLFATGVALSCGLAAGLSPARHGARGRVLTALQSSGGAAGIAAVPSRVRLSFIGFQAAVSMLLLVSAALLARSATRLASVDIGFDAERLLAISLQAPRSDFDESAYLDIAAALARSIPAVDRVSVSQYQPFGPSVEHHSTEDATFELNVHRSDAELFATLGLRLLSGRTFTPEEVAAQAPVAVISETIAHTFFADRDPIGQSVSQIPLREGSARQSATIVGVISDALLMRVRSQRFGTVYYPLSRQRGNPPSLLIRTATPSSTARLVEDALRGVDPRVQARTRMVAAGLGDFLDAKERLAWLVGPPALLTLVLAVLGVHGLTAFLVSQRMHEVSVRLALGASPAAILWLFVTGTLRPVVIGTVIGLGFALILGGVFAETLGGISPHDPLSVAAAAVLLVAGGLAAVVIPARRAASADPASLLRQP